MALTPEQKERRKAAKNARNRAWYERYRERNKAEVIGKESVEARFAERINTADAVEDAIMSERDAAVAEIDRQIGQLKARREAEMSANNEKYREARKVSSGICDRRSAAHSELQAALDDEFPDLKGHARWSAAAWKTLDEFLP